MTKYIVLGVVVGLLSGATSAFAATSVASRFQKAALFGSVEATGGETREIYKITDESTDCYIVASAIPAISCVK